MSNDKSLVSNFLSSQNLTVISSISSSGKPQSALVEFAETPELEIIFDTFNHFRKYENFSFSKDVSLVFDDRCSITIQYEGTVQELTSEELERYLAVYLKKIPDAEKFTNTSEIRWLKVLPRWIRYTDVLPDPWKVIEFDFKVD